MTLATWPNINQVVRSAKPSAELDVGFCQIADKQLAVIAAFGSIDFYDLLHACLL